MKIHVHLYDADPKWEETKHPRGPDGQFGAGSGKPSSTSSSKSSSASSNIKSSTKASEGTKIRVEPAPDDKGWDLFVDDEFRKRYPTKNEAVAAGVALK